MAMENIHMEVSLKCFYTPIFFTSFLKLSALLYLAQTPVINFLFSPKHFHSILFRTIPVKLLWNWNCYYPNSFLLHLMCLGQVLGAVLPMDHMVVAHLHQVASIQVVDPFKLNQRIHGKNIYAIFISFDVKFDGLIHLIHDQNWLIINHH